MAVSCSEKCSETKLTFSKRDRVKSKKTPHAAGRRFSAADLGEGMSLETELKPRMIQSYSTDSILYTPPISETR